MFQRHKHIPQSIPTPHTPGKFQLVQADHERRLRPLNTLTQVRDSRMLQEYVFLEL